MTRAILMASASALVASLAPMTATAQSVQPIPNPPTDAAPAVNGDAAATAEPTTQADDNRIGDIIVTATRRSEPLQRVPVAASVIGGENWAKTSNFSLENVAQAVPSVTFESTTSTRNNTIRIRGVGSSTTSSGVEPSTSTILDGLVLIRSGQAAATNLIDINRIEVLRGPQGTLFGKNASVGVINITTLDPAREVGGRVDAFITDDHERQLRGTLTGPLTDTLSARVSGFYRTYDGNVLNVFNGEKQNATEVGGGRAKILWEPITKLQVRLFADYTRNSSTCCARPLRRLDVTNTKGAAERAGLLPVVPGIENTRVNTDVEPVDSYTGANFGGQIDYQLGDYTLTSITGHQYFKIRQQLDDDLTSTGPIAGGQAFKQAITSVETVKGNTQELRLTSPTGGFFDFVAGAYYLDATIRQVSDNLRTRIAVPTRQYSVYDSSTQFRNYAAYGQGNFHFTERFSALFGARYTMDRVRNSYVRTDDPVAPFRSGSTAYALQNRKNDFSLKAGLQYQVTPRIFAYGTFAQGYKGPGFNVASNGLAANAALRPETSDNYELGLKSRFFDNRLSLNIALFDSSFSDFVVNAIDPATNSVQLVNAAKLHSRGVEADFDLRIGRSLSVFGGAAYVKATFDIANTPCFDNQTNAQGCFNITPSVRVQNIVDGDLPLSPDFKANIGVNYALIVPDFPFDLDFKANAVYTGSQQFSLNQDPTRTQGAYTLVDAAIAFTTKDKRLTIELFGKNLTDRFYISGIGTPTELTGSSLQFIPRDSSRYFGLRGTLDF